VGKSEWIGGGEAAEILGVGRTTVYRSLRDVELREQQWGREGEGWRYKPLTRRRIFQVRRSRAEKIAEAASSE
jgi:excisionase family DNA binding protein